MPPGQPSVKQSLKPHITALKVVKKMRWLTFILGPLAWGWDEYFYAIVEDELFEWWGINLISIEALLIWMLYDILDFLPVFGTPEQFELLFPHLRVICTVLFIWFMYWAFFKKDSVRRKAKELSQQK